jgi:hypothetical protein
MKAEYQEIKPAWWSKLPLLGSLCRNIAVGILADAVHTKLVIESSNNRPDPQLEKEVKDAIEKARKARVSETRIDNMISKATELTLQAIKEGRFI